MSIHHFIEKAVAMPSIEYPLASYDLHLHTYWSYDATATPECYFKCARELGVRCIAIADHHVLDSQHEVTTAAAGYPEVRSISSAELSVNTSIGGVDLLCYGFKEQRSPGLTKVLNMYHDWQCATGEAISQGMQALGYDFSDAHRLELLQSYRPAETIEVQGSTHIKNQFLCNYFVERGFISDAEEYSKLMRLVWKEGHSPSYPAADSVVPVVKEAGALVAIAHPFGYFNKDNESRMDSLREECSLDGIECAHQAIPAEYTSGYRAYCLQHGLFSVGGSDCHSDDDALSSLARHSGEDEWLDEFLERLDSR